MALRLGSGGGGGGGNRRICRLGTTGFHSHIGKMAPSRCRAQATNCPARARCLRAPRPRAKPTSAPVVSGGPKVGRVRRPQLDRLVRSHFGGGQNDPSKSSMGASEREYVPPRIKSSGRKFIIPPRDQRGAAKMLHRNASSTRRASPGRAGDEAARGSEAAKAETEEAPGFLLTRSLPLSQLAGRARLASWQGSLAGERNEMFE